MKKIGFKNFRRFVDFDPLELGSLTLLSGGNNSGKSTIVKAAMLAMNFLKSLTLAINDSKDTYIVSSAYTVFKVQDTNKLLPEYLFMFFNRPEFDRYARFNSWGSAREVFTMDDMNDLVIPIPNISVQREIVNIHKCYIERQRIAEALKEQLKNICPVLIRGSLNN